MSPSHPTDPVSDPTHGAATTSCAAGDYARVVRFHSTATTTASRPRSERARVRSSARIAPAGRALLGLMSLLGLASPASAASEPHDPVAGEALFREGRRLLKAGETDAACAKLRESHRLDPALGTLANLAECEEKRGHSASAWESWRRVADELPATDPRRATALARANELEKNLARLVIEVAPTAPAGTRITRDGVVLGDASLGVAMPVNPGPHLLVATALGRETVEMTVNTTAGETARAVMAPGRSLPATLPPSLLPPLSLARESLDAGAAASSNRSFWGYALVGTGVALAVTGTVFAIRAANAREQAERDCAPASGGPPLCWSRARHAIDRQRTSSRLADAGFLTGATLGAVGSWLIFGGRSGTAEGSHALRIDASGDGAEVQLAARF